MAVRVSATETNPTHHLSLTDGIDTLGLILSDSGGKVNALGLRQSGYPRSVTRISQGVSGYSDFELPYSPTVQSDFSGGRGLEDYEKDQTRFYDSYRADTTRGDILCGPKASIPCINQNTQTSGNANSWIDLQSTGATKFVATINAVNSVRLMAHARATSGATSVTLGVSIFSHNAVADEPDAQLAYAGQELAVSATPSEYTVPISTTLTVGTTYWLGLSGYPPGGLFQDGPVVGYTDTAGTTKSWMFPDGPWTAAQNNNLSFTLLETADTIYRFFEYRGSLYSVASPDQRGPAKLFMNGYHGMSQANTNTSYVQTGLTIPEGFNLTDAIVKIVAGKGSEEEQPWRVITSHTTGANAKLYVDTPWNTAHDTTTEFALVGTPYWTVLSFGTNAPSVPATDVMVLDDMVFIAFGEAYTIMRGKLTSGTWAWYYDGTNATTGSKATFLNYIYDVQGKKRVWRALAKASSVSYAAKPTWAASNSATLTFLTDVICGSSDSAITGIEEYSSGGPLIPYILKEDGFGSIGGTTDTVVGVYSEHPLSAQLKNVRSENNGRAHMRYDLFLKFSLLDGMESHYDQRIDDVGPNRDEGLPIGRRGPIYHMVPYAGRFYAAVDGGEEGYSSVLCCTRDNSWHEIYRGASGARIRRLCIQVIPGDTVDRLWISEGSTIYWLPLAIDPRKQADYTYHSGAQVITAWIYSGFKDVNKYFHELTIFAEGLSTTHQYIQAAYRVDNETTWTTIATNYTTSPSQTIRLSTTNNVSGKRIQLRFTLVTDNVLLSPRIKAYRLDGVIRLKPKKMWSVTYVVKDNQEDLTRTEQSGLTIGGVAASWTPENVLTLLDKWADSDQTADPLTMRTLRTLNDNKLVFIEPTSITPLSQVTDPDRKIVLVGSFTLLEA